MGPGLRLRRNRDDTVLERSNGAAERSTGAALSRPLPLRFAGGEELSQAWAAAQSATWRSRTVSGMAPERSTASW
jgi:hypothetical protein